jgi:hypothetical protein
VKYLLKSFKKTNGTELRKFLTRNLENVANEMNVKIRFVHFVPTNDDFSELVTISPAKGGTVQVQFISHSNIYSLYIDF